MAFCGRCGAQTEGNERFCVKCGNDLSVPGALASAPVSAAAPAAPPMAAFQPGYPAPGPFPAAVPMAPPVHMKGRGWLWGVILVVAAGYGYYYYIHNTQAQTPEQAPAQQPATGPAQPGGNPGQPPDQGQQPRTAPDQQPVQGQQPGPGQQPNAPGGQGGNQGVLRLQEFSGRWDPVSGMVQISNAVWRNNSNVAMQSAMLECVQYAVNGRAITQSQIRLNGPVRPGGADSFQPFTMGAISPYMARVNCGIVSVTPAQ